MNDIRTDRRSLSPRVDLKSLGYEPRIARRGVIATGERIGDAPPSKFNHMRLHLGMVDGAKVPYPASSIYHGLVEAGSIKDQADGFANWHALPPIRELPVLLCSNDPAQVWTSGFMHQRREDDGTIWCRGDGQRAFRVGEGERSCTCEHFTGDNAGKCKLSCALNVLIDVPGAGLGEVFTYYGGLNAAMRIEASLNMLDDIGLPLMLVRLKLVMAAKRGPRGMIYPLHLTLRDDMVQASERALQIAEIQRRVRGGTALPAPAQSLVLGMHTDEGELIDEDGVVLEEVTPQTGIRHERTPFASQVRARPPTPRTAARATTATVYDLSGRGIPLAEDDVDGWIDSQLGFASPDELDRLVALNPNLPTLETLAAQVAARRRSETATPPAAADAQATTTDADAPTHQETPPAAEQPDSASKRQVSVKGEWDGEPRQRVTTQLRAEIVAAIEADPYAARKRMDDRFIVLFNDELADAIDALEGVQHTGKGPPVETPAPALYMLKDAGGHDVDRRIAEAFVKGLEDRVDVAQDLGQSAPTALLRANASTLAAIAADRADLADRCLALSKPAQEGKPGGMSSDALVSRISARE
jgi:hypothetical protein